MNNNFKKLTVKFFNFVYKLQEKKHKNRMEKLNKNILSGNICGKKYIAAHGATLSLNNKNFEEEKVNQKKLENIVEKYINEPEKFFNFIKGAKTPIYKIKLADKILSYIDEQEGFILPQKGFKALYLNLILNKKISFKTTEMFVLRNGELNTYAFIYQFYNWYCYKMKLSGYEDKTQKMFKNVFKICETDAIDDLNCEEIINLKSAIQRDIEAINFVKKVVQKFSMAKKNLDKIKQGESIRV